MVDLDGVDQVFAELANWEEIPKDTSLVVQSRHPCDGSHEALAVFLAADA